MLGAPLSFQVGAGAISILRLGMARGRGGRRRGRTGQLFSGCAARPEIATAAGRAFAPWAAAITAERELASDLMRISNKRERGPTQDLRAAPNG